MERDLKRISLMIGEDQYEQISKRGLNLSWLVRDLLDNYLNDNKISLHVTDETRQLYEKIIGSDSGDPDPEFEPFLKDALRSLLKLKIENMQKLEKNAFKENKREDV
jgi:hypothetical protein